MQPHDDARTDPPGGEDRFEQLYEIGKLLASTDSSEAALPRVLALANEVLPLRTAVLHLRGPAGLRVFAWRAERVSEIAVGEAKIHARTAYAYLCGASPESVGRDSVDGGRTLVGPSRAHAPIASPSRYVTIPLTLQRGIVFGALQLSIWFPVAGAPRAPSIAAKSDGADLGETDLAFADALARQLAIFVDRCERWHADVAGRARAEEAERTLQIALGARDHILRIVSHDLRNPIGAMLMRATMLMDEKPRPDRLTLRNGLAAIQCNAERVLRLIEDMTDFASLERGRFTLERALHMPLSIVRDAARVFQPLADEHRLTVNVACAGQLVPIFADGHRLRQVLANLLANALRATPSGGAITLRVEEHDGQAVFSVADTGRGMTPSEIDEAFVAQWRAGPPIQGRTGLGLSIARGIVGLHGGRIWAESNLGHGSTVSFTLPPCTDARPAPSAQIRETGRAPDALEAPILLVEDDSETSDLLIAMLRGDGFDVLAAFDGASALEVLKTALPMPRVVLLDLTMPGISSDDFFAELRGDPKTAGVAVIVVSARSDIREAAASLGAAGWLAKPFDPQALNDAVLRCTKGLLPPSN